MAGVEIAQAYIALTTTMPNVKKDIEKALPKDIDLPEPELPDPGPETKRWGEKFKAGIVVVAGVAATALAAGFSAALSNAISIEAATDKVAAQLGLTEEQSAATGEAAANAYKNAFGESMEDVQAATAAVVGSIEGMRDASSSAIQDITEKVLTISDGFEIEADRISQVVGQMISTGLVENAEQGLDLLTAALQKVPPAVREDIIDAVDEYGPFFKQIGIDGDEAMSALVAASEKGMYGIDKTGDALKEFTIRGTDMSQASVDAYKAIGLSAGKMSEALLAGGEKGAKAFDQIVKGLRGIKDPVMQSQAALALFGTPLEDLGTNEIPAFLDALAGTESALGDVSGAAEDMAATMGGNVATSWTQLQRSFETIAATIVGALLPVLQPILDWAIQNPELLMAVATAVGILAVAFGILAAVQWVLNTAMLASPITWIVLAIVALIAAVVLLVANWDAVVAWITEIWSGFISWITGVIDGFVSWWNATWAAVGKFISDLWNRWIVAPIRNAINWIAKTVSDMIRNIRTGWENGWSAIGDFVRGIWNNIVGWIESGVNGAIDLINGFTGGIRDVAGAVFGVEIGPIPHVSIPRLADGGIVSASKGGTLAVIGEGGRDEAVVPLPPDWKQNGLGGGSGLTINGDVYTQDVDEFVRTIETEKRRAYWTAGVFA